MVFLVLCPVSGVIVQDLSALTCLVYDHSEAHGFDKVGGKNSSLLSIAQKNTWNAFLNIMVMDTGQIAKPESFCKEVNG